MRRGAGAVPLGDEEKGGGGGDEVEERKVHEAGRWFLCPGLSWTYFWVMVMSGLLVAVVLWSGMGMGFAWGSGMVRVRDIVEQGNVGVGSRLTGIAAHSLQLPWPFHRAVKAANAQKLYVGEVEGANAHIPALGGISPPSSFPWSALCGALLPVEAGYLRSAGGSALDPETKQDEARAIDARVEFGSAFESNVLRGLLGVHTDVCVGLTDAVVWSELREHNPTGDPKCQSCSVSRLASAIMGKPRPFHPPFILPPPPRPRVAVIGIGRAVTPLRAWVNSVGAGAGDAETILHRAMVGFSGSEERGEGLSVERIVVVYGADEKLGDAPQGKGIADMVRAVRRIISQRLCTDVLLLRSEALLDAAKDEAEAKTWGSKVPHTSSSTSSVSTALLTSVADFVGMGDERTVEVLLPMSVLRTWAAIASHIVVVSAEEDGEMPVARPRGFYAWGRTTMDFLPAVAMLRSSCSPKPGANARTCSSRPSSPPSTIPVSDALVRKTLNLPQAASLPEGGIGDGSVIGTGGLAGDLGQGPQSRRTSLPRMPTRHVHMHRVAGEALCAAGVKHGENTPQHATHPTQCSLAGAGEAKSTVRSDGHSLPLSCHAVLEALSTTKATFGSTDVPVEQPMCDAALSYTTILRNPLQRILSSTAYHRDNVEDLESFLWTGDVGVPPIPNSDNLLPPSTSAKHTTRMLLSKRVKEGGRNSEQHASNPLPSRHLAARAKKSTSDLTTEGQGFLLRGASLSNYQTRMLLGTKAYFLPLHAVGDVQLERAKAVLRRMCAVVVQEELGMGTWGLEAALGWKHPNYVNSDGSHSMDHVNLGGLQATSSWPPPNFRPSLITLLEEANAVDVKLLQYARTISPGASIWPTESQYLGKSIDQAAKRIGAW